MTRMRVSLPALVAACLLALSACGQPSGVRDAVIVGEDPAAKLSDYGLFSDLSARQPAEGGQVKLRDNVLGRSITGSQPSHAAGGGADLVVHG